MLELLKKWLRIVTHVSNLLASRRDFPCLPVSSLWDVLVYCCCLWIALSCRWHPEATSSPLTVQPITALRLPRIAAGASIPVYFGVFCGRIYHECELMRSACPTGGTNWRDVRCCAYGLFTAIIWVTVIRIIRDNPLRVHLCVPVPGVLETSWSSSWYISAVTEAKARVVVTVRAIRLASAARLRAPRRRWARPRRPSAPQHPAPRLVPRPLPPPFRTHHLLF